MADIGEIVKTLGGVAGVVALSWKIFEEVRGYLKIRVQATKQDNAYSIQTEIENTNKWKSKKIDNSFLIVSKEHTDLINFGKQIAKELGVGGEIFSTNQFENLKSKKPIYIDRKIAFIPLDFYFSENITIGDEKLTYRCSIDDTQLEKGNYSVRFYIYGEKRYHRSTQDLFKII